MLVRFVLVAKKKDSRDAFARVVCDASDDDMSLKRRT